ncbi:hypothetical protein FGG08_006580 [Glutinoglossum americanum]|uniref:Protein kinase domain-containing protein n=1 Tax=Glutinoglossum americanum TaxID=1670608 RepID=A0A9P8HY05_9PEZI|nr:hypothetical protein FGG08_006580 [Glutinoglossum americanum]
MDPPPIEQLSMGRPDAVASATMYRKLEERMAEFFPASSGDATMSRTQFLETEIQQISRLLQRINSKWSKVPRAYIVLRLIGQLHLLDAFIAQGITDFWFPFSVSSLPDSINSSTRANFVRVQSVVLTKAVDLEKGDRGVHQHFAEGEPLPFESKAILGSGGFGQVDKVLSLISYNEYARKRIRRGKVFKRAKENMKSFKAELEVLKRLKHRHVVELVGSYTDSAYLGLIMSPVADSNLAMFLAQVAGSPDERPLLRTFFGCLSYALQYLHNSQIRHKDIKPQNILVKGSNVLFTDFGVSLDWSDMSRSTTQGATILTPKYCAPEVADYEPRNASSDIWSLGCVFLEMATVLKGETLDDMKAFLDTQGSQSQFYRNNPVATEKWMLKLESVGAEPDSDPILWVREMLQVDRSARPTVGVLVERISNRDSMTKGTSFCGICCLRGGDEDDDSFDDEDSGLDNDTKDTTVSSKATGSSLVRKAGSTLQAAVVLPSQTASKTQVPSGDREVHPSPKWKALSPRAVAMARLPQPDPPTPVFGAIQRGDNDGLYQLLGEGADATTVDQRGISPLYKAVWMGNEDAVRMLLDKGANGELLSRSGLKILQLSTNWDWPMSGLLIERGADLHDGGDDGMTLLHTAAIYKNAETVKQLIARGLDVNARSKAGMTPLDHCTDQMGLEIAGILIVSGARVDLMKDPLYLAVVQRNEGFVKLLVENGVDVNSEFFGRPCLSWALTHGDESMVQLLLSLGANADHQSMSSGDRSRIAAMNVTSESPASVKRDALILSVKGGNEVEVKRLLNMGVDIEMKDDGEGRTALQWAAWGGKSEVTRLLLEKGAKVDAKDDNGRAALFLAAEGGYGMDVQQLLEKGANPGMKDDNGNAPLLAAALRGHGAVVQQLLEGGADMEACNENGETALHRAVKANHAGVVQALLERGMNIDAKDNTGKPALHMAAYIGHGSMVQLLLQRGASVDATDMYGLTALHRAVYRETNKYIVQQLLQHGASVNAKSSYGKTALHIAAYEGYKALVRLLLDSGALVNEHDSEGWTPLYWAAYEKHKPIVQLLLDYSADINAHRPDGWTPLYRAAYGGDIEMLKILLEKGADTEIPETETGQTPLQIALSNNHTKAVQLLIAAGSSVSSKNLYDTTPLHKAVQAGNLAMVKTLVEKGADIGAKTKGGTTPLHSAVSVPYFHEGVVKFLVEKGADVDAATDSGETPIMIASWGNKGVLEFLKARSKTPNKAYVAA